MPMLKELLIEKMQDLLHGETQVTEALPKMMEAAHHPKLKEAFEKHLLQTQMQIERLNRSFELLGSKATPKPCRGMMGIIEEGEETIKEGQQKEPLLSDLALMAAAQKVEHYEICGYGTARTLARQLGFVEVATLLSHTLGEEESTDFLLTELSKPLLQQAALDEMGADVNLEATPQGTTAGMKKKMGGSSSSSHKR